MYLGTQTYIQLENLKIPILYCPSLLHLTLDRVNTFVFSIYGLTSAMYHSGRGGRYLQVYQSQLYTIHELLTIGFSSKLLSSFRP